jgi:intracellular sulfur oxidation DsrE/DsrF family protein
MRIAWQLAVVAAPALFFAQSADAGQDRANPVIAPYGKITPADNAAMRPESTLRYRVVFSVTKAGPDADKPNPSLDKVARMVNLLGAYGIQPQKGDIVAVVHGAATPIVATDAVYAAKTKVQRNPNLDLIAKLRAAGVVVSVCSQALHGNDIEPKDVAPGVEVDVSAMTTLATLQLKGWALMPD